jgi:large subunit ribosomal protein L25
MAEKAEDKKERAELKVSKREVLGKQVKKLREQGIVPANLYGHGKASQALQVDAKELLRAITRAGGGGLVFLKIGTRGRAQPAMTREVQRHPRTSRLLHVDFQSVLLTEKVRTEVPLHFEGVAPGAKEGVLIHEISSLAVEGLPEALPHAIVVDISGLAEVGQAIKVSEVSLPKGVSALVDPETVVAKIEAPARVEEVAPAAPAAEVAEEVEGEKAAPEEEEGKREEEE